MKDHIISYVQRTYRHGQDIAISLRDLKKRDLTSEEPTRKISSKTDDNKKLEQDGFDMRYQAEIKQFLDRQSGLEENLMKAYALIFGTYCSKAIQSRVEEHPDFETTIRDDPIELLKTINMLMHDTVRAKYPYASLHDIMMRLFNLRQQEHEHLTDYVKRFKQTKDVVKAHMGSKWLEQFVEHTEEYQKETDTKQQSELKNQSFERYMAFILLRNSDQAKYRSLMNGLISQYSMENDQYPELITTAIDILANHKHDNYSLKKDEKYKKQDEDDNKSTTSETSFAQFNGVTCYCCGKKGHKSPQCPEKDTRPRDQWAIRRAEQHLQAEADGDDDGSTASNATSGTNRSFQNKGWSGLQVNLMNHEDSQSMRESITLDNGSTLSLFCNPELVKDIRQSNTTLKMHTNAGSKESNQQATVPGFGNVWFHEEAIANIFGFGDLASKYRITYDSEKEDAFLVHMKHKTVKFTRTPEGLYQFTVPQSYKEELKMNQEEKSNNMIQTVEENKIVYTKRQMERAKVARKLYHIVGSPTLEAFKAMLKSNIIKNCPVTAADVDIAENIYSPAISTLKGKTTRQTPKPVVADEVMIPSELLMKHRQIELCMDTMFVNKQPFLTSIDKSVRFRSLVPLKSQSGEEYLRALQFIMRHYNKGGFFIQLIHCDGEYKQLIEPVQDKLNATMNFANPGDHVPEAERNNRTIKERIRAAFH